MIDLNDAGRPAPPREERPDDNPDQTGAVEWGGCFRDKGD